MSNAYVLDPDEAVILQESKVSAESFGSVDLVLTNKNLIQVNKSFFGKDKDSYKYPLSDLKLLNGRANVLVGKNRNGTKRLELYFSDAERFFSFNTFFSANKWASEIQKAHKKRMAEIERSKKTANKNSVIKAILGAIDSANDKNVQEKAQTKRFCKCPNCGAELVGFKGEEVMCSYCQTAIIIK